MAQDVKFVILVTLLLIIKNVAGALFIRHNCGEHKNNFGHRCSREGSRKFQMTFLHI